MSTMAYVQVQVEMPLVWVQGFKHLYKYLILHNFSKCLEYQVEYKSVMENTSTGKLC